MHSSPFNFSCFVFVDELLTLFVLFVDLFKVFDRPLLHFIKDDQTSALASHDDGSALTGQADYPQATYHLLGYTNTTTYFTKIGKYKDEDLKV